MAIVEQLLSGDVSFFAGDTAKSATGWLSHPERYRGQWLRDVEARLPRRYPKVLLFGMGGSSSPARFYADAMASENLTVVDTTHPDTVASLSFEQTTVIASSKSGTTVETQTLLAHALASGLEPADLVIITDPGTSLAELGFSLGALVIFGDPATGGRFSALSPFGLVPALYAGWTLAQLDALLEANTLTGELLGSVVADSAMLIEGHHAGEIVFPLSADPVMTGAGMWLDQLVAETTGKSGRGFIPVLNESGPQIAPNRIMYFQLLAALLANGLDVDPFNQPDVELAKKQVFSLLRDAQTWETPAFERADFFNDLREASYLTVQAFAPFTSQAAVAQIRMLMQTHFTTTTANLGPRYLHSTGQLHKGGPDSVLGLQILQRPKSPPQRIAGRRYSFHDLHMAQANSDFLAMRAAGRSVYQIMVDDVSEVSTVLGLTP